VSAVDARDSDLVELIGRDEELRAIGEFVDAEPAPPAALLLDGPAGIGKTTLWAEAVRRARERGLRLLLSRPASEETRLAFAGVGDLLAPALDEALPALPRPQRRALEVALLQRDPAGAAPDERAVLTAFTGAVHALAAACPLLLAVDDVQWLDAPSVAALAFALARLGVHENVRVLVARRTDDPAETPPLGLDRPRGVALTRLVVGSLSVGALSRLLRTRLGAALPRPAMVRISELSAGNPFFALELGRGLLAGGRPTAGRLPVPTTLTELLQERLDDLPDETRDVLLLVAAAGRTTTSALERVLGGDPWPALRPAIAGGVVEVDDGNVAFSHPLHGEAVYGSADADRRRRAHVAFAAVAEDPEERARHLAHGLVEPDATAADALEDAARRTRRRGARSVSAELFEAAGRLTPPSDAATRARRLLSAASATFDAGDSERACTLLERLVVELDPGAELTEAQWRLGIVLDETGHWREAMRLWEDALATAKDLHLVAELRRSMAVTACYTGSLSEALAHADASVAAAEASGRVEQRAYAAAARAFVGVLAADPSYETFVARALELEPLVDAPARELSPSAAAAECARLVHDLAEAKRRFENVLARAVESGDAAVEQWAAYGLADVELELGCFRRADALAEVVLELAEQTSVMRLPGLRLRAHVDAYLGRVDAAHANAGESLAESRRLEETMHERGARIVLGFLALSEGDAALAADHLREARGIADALDLREPRMLRHYLDEAEAAAAAGSSEQAGAALAAFRTRVPDAPEWIGPLLLRAEAVVGADGAVTMLESALAAPALGELPFERARTLLALGVARRRVRARGAAREALAEAAAEFDRLGTPLWAARAREELSHVGGRARGDALTNAERRVAELAAQGRSNKEIAAALVVSVKTVEATLSRVYRKLGVRSRAALGRTLAAQSVGEPPLPPASVES
jgi:DNA-binding CsgD family transcriptional regulator/tetratricopeptide (TPR) repeat protein